MDFYNSTESFDSYEGIQIKEQEVISYLTKTHPAFTYTRQTRKLDDFSSLSAEERFTFSKKIKDLQRLINAIQTEINSEIPETGFTLEEVLEVLNVRRAMHKKRKE